MAHVAGIELEKDAAGNDSYVRIDLKKYGDRINPISRQLGVKISDNQTDEFEQDWERSLTIEEFRLYAKQELRKHFYHKYGESSRRSDTSFLRSKSNPSDQEAQGSVRFPPLTF